MSVSWFSFRGVVVVATASAEVHAKVRAVVLSPVEVVCMSEWAQKARVLVYLCVLSLRLHVNGPLLTLSLIMSTLHNISENLQ